MTEETKKKIDALLHLRNHLEDECVSLEEEVRVLEDEIEKIDKEIFRLELPPEERGE